MRHSNYFTAGDQVSKPTAFVRTQDYIYQDKPSKNQEQNEFGKSKQKDHELIRAKQSETQNCKLKKTPMTN